MNGAYKNSIEHLYDELKLLDLRLEHAISRITTSQGRQDWNEYSGLYISEGEVANAVRADKVISPRIEDNRYYRNNATDEIEVLKEIIEKRSEQSERVGVVLFLRRLSKALSLSYFETNVLLICIAPEIDSKYEKVYAFLHNDVTRKKPTIGLILEILCSSIQEKVEARGFFLPSGPLLRFNVIGFDLSNVNSSGWGPSSIHTLSAPLKIDESILNFLLGYDEIDSRIQSFSRLINVKTQSMNTQIIQELIEDRNRIVDLVKHSRKGVMEAHQKTMFHDHSLNPKIKYYNPTFYFGAQYGAGKKTLAKSISRELESPLLVLDIVKATDSDDFEEIIKIFFREALLREAIIYLDHFDAFGRNEQKADHNLDIILRNIMNAPELVVILSGEKPPETKWFRNSINPLVINFPTTTFEMRKIVWASLLRYYSCTDDVDIDDLATKFRFSPGQIKDAILRAKNMASLKLENQQDEPFSDDLYASCRDQSNEKLATLAQKASASSVWDDLVLPENKKQHLKEIFSHVKYRNLVYSKWGFEEKLALGKGINILFAGGSGCGKTMAAQIIAKELKMDLYKIDLSSIVSKYIGETEKNISRIFKEAETSNAILFFDEADALFGKRSEVKDAKDRYANIEINYLLQKLEEHREIVILASNLAQNIDDAFARRMHFWIEFSFPDEKSRLRIWKNIFPKGAPLDVDIDFDFIANQFHISGGGIRNAALKAAFFAAESKSPCISMSHIIRAIKREFEKMGKPCLKSDFGKYYDLLDNKTRQEI